MSSEGIRVSFDLPGLMQLGLVHRRLWTLAHGDAFVHPDELERLAIVLDGVFGDDGEVVRTMINDLRRKRHGA